MVAGFEQLPCPLGRSWDLLNAVFAALFLEFVSGVFRTLLIANNSNTRASGFSLSGKNNDGARSKIMFCFIFLGNTTVQEESVPEKLNMIQLIENSWLNGRL